MANTATGKASAWLNAQLKANTTISTSATGIHRGKAPDRKQTPLVVYRYLPTGKHERVVGAKIIDTVLEFVVVAIGNIPEPSSGLLDSLGAAIKTALELQHSGAVLCCQEVRPYEISYTIDGIEYQEIGGIYRLTMQT